MRPRCMTGAMDGRSLVYILYSAVLPVQAHTPAEPMQDIFPCRHGAGAGSAFIGAGWLLVGRVLYFRLGRLYHA